MATRKTARESRNMANQAWAMHEHMKLCKDAGKPITPAKLAKEWGYNLALVDTLLRIVDNLTPDVMQSWRESDPCVSVAEMERISQLRGDQQMVSFGVMILETMPPMAGETELRGVLLAFADDINSVTRLCLDRLANIDCIDDPNNGISLNLGQATELAMLGNHLVKRAMDLASDLQGVSHPDDIARFEPDPMAHVRGAPPIGATDPDPATVFGGDKHRAAAQKRLDAKRAKRRKSGKG